jgi:hydroxymethylglutaryl-CoA lyase
MPERVTIVECPRDAFQGLPRFIPTQVKIDYLISLFEAGFTHIDFGSFVSAQAVPQMQDTKQVVVALKPHLRDITLIAIVPNLKGLQKAIEAGGIRAAGYPLSVSETFQKRNVHQNLEQSWKVVDDLKARATADGIELIVYLSMAFGNPYGDVWSPEHVVRFVERLVARGISEISLADTVGTAEPEVVRDLVGACLERFPQTRFGVHLHSRPDRWEEPVRAALQVGCRRFDGALRGIGGCPFANDTLVGNIPTEGLIKRLNQMGMSTNLSEEAIQPSLARALRIVEEYGANGMISGVSPDSH